jgi:hypothetical protein
MEIVPAFIIDMAGLRILTGTWTIMTKNFQGFNSVPTENTLG